MIPSREYGLAPIVGKNPLVLILGSFPSKMSLTAELYYANPRNHFWPIMQLLFSLETDRAGGANQRALAKHHIAIWDVISSRAFQTSAMDRDIRDPALNDIPAFLRTFPTIRFIGLNGGKAAECFRKGFSGYPFGTQLTIMRLPSTSPANATYSFTRKLEQWRIIMEYLLDEN